jgi:hypothetical protein
MFLANPMTVIAARARCHFTILYLLTVLRDAADGFG